MMKLQEVLDSLQREIALLHQRVARLEGESVDHQITHDTAPRDPLTPVLIDESHWNDGDMDLRAKARIEFIDSPKSRELGPLLKAQVAFDAGWDAAIDFVLTNYKVRL